jgi:hypothetical protein
MPFEIGRESGELTGLRELRGLRESRGLGGFCGLRGMHGMLHSLGNTHPRRPDRGRSVSSESVIKIKPYRRFVYKSAFDQEKSHAVPTSISIDGERTIAFKICKPNVRFVCMIK